MCPAIVLLNVSSTISTNNLCAQVINKMISDRIILFYMDNLIRTGGLFYIKVHEKTAMKKEKEKRSTNQDRKSL